MSIHCNLGNLGEMGKDVKWEGGLEFKSLKKK